MANTKLFRSARSKFTPAEARNEAGGLAYRLAPKQALAQLAATGCFGGTFYAAADAQLAALVALIDQVDDNAFLAKLAVYARECALMKDMPAALVAALAKRDPELMHRAFDRVIDNGRMLRTLLQIVRSGQLGKRSLSSALQRAFRRWLNTASVEKLLAASIGNDPSLRDVLRLARPKPRDNARRALFGWLTGKEIAKWTPATEADLPEQVRLLAAYRRAESDGEQAKIALRLSVRWDLLADAARGPQTWKAIARQMGPQALRMNLNTLLRHGVLDDDALVHQVADRLADADEIRRSRQFPYQFLAAYLNAETLVPQRIRAALHKAAEIACGNVPELPGPVVIGLDVSGSMSSAITGHRGRGAMSKMRCVDVAALVAAALLRRNPDSVVIPFDTSAYEPRVDPHDSILGLAERLARYGGGGTECALPLQAARVRYSGRKFAGVVLVSDMESWVYGGTAYAAGRHGSTGVLTEWSAFLERQRELGNPQPKLVCINLQPYATTQAPERDDVLNVGGFSDAVFSVIAGFLADDANRFVAEVEAIAV
jgi:60 kDa SS-A/Ro ribonucleoprotein